MNRVLSLAKYQLSDNKIAVVVYYTVLAAIALLLISISGSGSEVSGLSSSSIIFIFVVGLNCFKQSFLFSQANNLSRRTFYLAAVLSLVGLAVIMSACNFVLDSILGRLASYTGLFEEMYQAGAAAEILWTAALLTFFASVGWLVTMLYYRSHIVVKLLLYLP